MTQFLDPLDGAFILLEVPGSAMNIGAVIELDFGEVADAKERFGLASSSQVLSCYEAGRDGFWLHRHLRGVGIENEAVDSSSRKIGK